MADPGSSIFNKRATEKLRSPDDLEKYVRVTNPSVWVVLAACIAMLVGLLAWGIFGAVTTSVSGTGTMLDNKVVCFLSAEDAAHVVEGNDAVVQGESMTVTSKSQVPLSRDEASKVLESDYLVSALLPDDWAYEVTLEGDTSEMAEGVPLALSITTERIAPISLILGAEK